MKENSKLAGYDEQQILNLIENKSGGGNLKNVLLLTVDKMGNGYLQMKEREGVSFQVERLVSA